MVQWVYETANEVFENVAVATDDKLIVDAVNAFGGEVVMTSDTHKNGTSRVIEAYQKLNWNTDYVINIQGDEPMISSRCLQDLAGALQTDIDICTLIARVDDEKELFGESEVFVVKDMNDFALYFSRAIIPFHQNIPQDQWVQHGTFLKHVGLYAFNSRILNRINKLEASPLELAESLEQNRWLQYGMKIKLALTSEQSYPVDTAEDVELVRALMTDKYKKKL